MIREMGVRKALEGRMWDKEKGRRGEAGLWETGPAKQKIRFISFNGKRTEAF